MPSTSFDEFVQEIIDNATVEELLLFAAAREAIIASDDNYPDSED
jgi:hypothetical protein